MAKRKKKPNQSNLQKVSRAQHRNEYMVQLKSFCDRIAGTELFPLIPEAQLERIYFLRYQPVRVRGIENVPSYMLKDVKVFVTEFLKVKMVALKIGNISELSFYDFFTFFYTMVGYGDRLEETLYPAAAKVKKVLAPLIAFFDSEAYSKMWLEYQGLMNAIGVLYGDLRSWIFATRHEIRHEVNGKLGLSFCMEIYGMQTEKIQVVIDDNSRPAFRAGWCFGYPEVSFHSLSVNPEELNLPPGKPIDVYVQSHALNRLAERIDGIYEGYLHFSLFESFKKLNLCKNRNGDLLFEFRMDNKKAGYFTGDVIEGRLILRTFLFITNSGTPEGELLQKNTGLIMEDKKYLAIDKFSTFIKSDITTNEKVKEIFINAGCESLFAMDPNVYPPSEMMKGNSVAENILKYLKLDTTVPALSDQFYTG